MAIYYVATDGSNNGTGSAASPWRTISHAMQSNLRPGDEVVVRPGVYNEAISITRSGSAAGDITLRSEVEGAALIRPPAGAWNAISVNANHVTIKGFDIKGNNGDGIEANNVHHITILDNKIHDAGESGIQFNWSEFIRIEGNHTYNNAWSGWFSGISIYQTRNITGDTTTTGYRTIVRNNVSHDNVTNGGAHTDGNGIIIDDFQSTQTSGFPNYTYATLVENNLVYENGGKGIAVHWSDNVTVRNNTAWHNNQDNLNTGTWRGELSNQDSRNTTWVNNIAVADPRVNSNNTAIGFYGVNGGNVWANNLTFNGTVGSASFKLEGGANPAPTAANGNLLGVNPLFVNPAAGDFTLQPGSPALNRGTAAYGLGSTDLDGGPRAVGAVDLGAYESDAAAANRAPTAVADSGFVTPSGTPLTLTSASLLANDRDPDGDALRVASVGSATGGAVSLRADGTILFTPTADFAGSAGFSYTIADGRGGSSTAGVSVSVAAPVVGANKPPVARADSATTTENSVVSISLLTNDTDPDGNALRVQSLNTTGTKGSVSLGTNGVATYDPRSVFDRLAVGQTGTDTFAYVVSDGQGGVASATVTVTVTGVNDAPVAVADGGLTATVGAPLTIAASSLLSNDRDVDGDALSVSSVSNAVNGSVALLPGGSVLFTPASGAVGPASFRYTISDGKGGVASATANVTISGPDDEFSFWTDAARPAVASKADYSPVELGLRFRADVDGDVTALRFFKGPDNDGLHSGRLWSADGRQLASVTFTGETSSGWQEARLSAPVTLEAGKTYVASYHAPQGGYAINQNALSTTFDAGPLTLLAGGGVYAYGRAGSFPSSRYLNSNYWVDVVFNPDEQFDLLLSAAANRSGARDLQGAVVSGDAYIFTSGTEQAAMVQFFLDNPTAAGAPLRTERSFAHDFGGTRSDGGAFAWNTRLVTDGTHSVTAKIYDASGAFTLVTETFVVDNF